VQAAVNAFTPPVDDGRSKPDHHTSQVLAPATAKRLRNIAQGCRVLAATLGWRPIQNDPSPPYSGERAGVRGFGCFAAIRPLPPTPLPRSTEGEGRLIGVAGLPRVAASTRQPWAM